MTTKRAFDQLAAAACVVGFITAIASASIGANVVFSGATLIDGSGDPGRPGDVAVRDGRIVALGEFDPPADCEVIDATGLVIAPGFIDLHNHSDFARETDKGETRAIHALATRSAMCYLTQGCTTIVTGNCGGGALDVAAYYEELRRTPPGVNVAQLIPQGAVRESVIGSTRRQPTAAEVGAMRQLVRRGMEAGAWGMTTGLQYVPSSYADADEIVALAEVIAEYGGVYASHIRNEGDTLVESVDELIDIARRSGCPGHVSHFKAGNRRNWGKVRVAAARIRAARQAGLTITADQYPYAASSTSISAMLLPDEEREGGREATIARLNDPVELERLKPIIAESLEARGRIMVAACPDHPGWVGRMLREIAADEGKPPLDVALAILRSTADAGVSFSMSPQDVRWVMCLPWVATASDGGVKVADGTSPHPRSFGTFPRKIGRFAIEEAALPIEQAVRSATGLPAEILGLTDRGYLRVGLAADVVVFDPETIRDTATYQAPFGVSAGVRWLLVNGEVAIREGQLERTDAGRALRKPIHSAADGGGNHE